MSLETALGGRPASPASSGRSTPIARTTRRNIDDEKFLKSDKNLRRYASLIERALASWEIAPEEWADYIAFLARLLKAVQAHPQASPILPHSGMIATRLAQCLSPTLPSGVHQKALEVYNYVFDTFGAHFIASHLHEYLPGLAGVLSFASLSVRPGLYYLFEEHIITLPATDLRPALKSLILSLLPALEEESGEDFERAFLLLQALEKVFSSTLSAQEVESSHDGYFWQCLFLATITSPTRRQGSLNYLIRRLPKFDATSAAALASKTSSAALERPDVVLSPEPGLLIRCFVCGLSDPHILVQRGFLDLLASNLPLNSFIFSEKVEASELDKLVTAAIQVLLRRDMGLNRRLWSWFLGPEKKDITGSQQSSPTRERKDNAENDSNSQINYFAKFGHRSLERCLLNLLQAQTEKAADRARPYRICLSLMDRWEIGGMLISQIFMPAITSLHRYTEVASPDAVAEVVRSASLFFDGVEAELIWRSLLVTLHHSLESGSAGVTDDMTLISWVLSTFNIKDEEMLTVHIPRMLLYVLSRINTSGSTTNQDKALLALAARLQDSIPARSFETSPATPAADLQKSHNVSGDRKSASRMVVDFYENDHESSHASQPLSPLSDVASLIIEELSTMIIASLVSHHADLLTPATMMLVDVLHKTRNKPTKRVARLRSAILDVFGVATTPSRQMPFTTISSVISLLFASNSSEGNTFELSAHDLVSIEPSLMRQIWLHLSPSHAKYHVEAVKLIWHLEELLSPHSLVGSLAGLVRAQADARNASPIKQDEVVRRFAVIWNHTVTPINIKVGSGRRKVSSASAIDAHQSHKIETLIPSLMLVLDILFEPDTPAAEAVKIWIHGLPTLDQIFQHLFAKMQTASLLTSPASKSDSRQSRREKRERIREVLYTSRHFENLLRDGNAWTWQCLSNALLPTDVAATEQGSIVQFGEACAELLFSADHDSEPLNRCLISILRLMLSTPNAAALKHLDIDLTIMKRLSLCVAGEMSDLQGELLRLLGQALKLRFAKTNGSHVSEKRSRGSISTKHPPVVNLGPVTSNNTPAAPSLPLPQLFQCVQLGFSARSARYHLDQWLIFLSEILPIVAEAIFVNLIPLVDCLCRELATVHQELISLSNSNQAIDSPSPDTSMIQLLDALEMVLDRAYESLIAESSNEPAPKATESSASFLTNVASGVFKMEGPTGKTAKANNRLTVILALHDSIRVILKMWLWASSPTEGPDIDQTSISTISYHALKVRNKTRHLLEQIFTVEPLESLELIMTHWRAADEDVTAASTLNFLHVMQVSRPKNVVTATLDALYSRTSSTNLPASRMSSQTVELSASDVALFLSAYLQSIEDDATDEIWPECIAFLRDVLANPLPYRQILPHMLSIILLLAEKLNNTNYGEQRKMRKELGDILQRLLTATFTTLPSGYVSETSSANSTENGAQSGRLAALEASVALVVVLSRITAEMDKILEAPERITTIITTMSTSFVSPMLRAKSFPKNINKELLSTIVHMAQKAPSAKSWKKDVSDAFNDPRILSSPVELMRDGWFPLFHQWSLFDKERLPELLLRLAPPSTAGIMFGVGASAARTEADRRTQLNLRRICLLLLASPNDTHVLHLRTIQEKLAELFEASTSSSPSTAIKAELFMLCRALTVTVSDVHLMPLWPIINDKLHAAFTSMLGSPALTGSEFNNLTLLQACRLLDLLVATAPDDFQLHEWLYVTDTIDAVHQPAEWAPVAIADHIAAALNSSYMEDSLLSTPATLESATGTRHRTLLSDELIVDNEDVKAFTKEDFMSAVVKPFLSQLSIHAYEGVYSMATADVDAIKKSLLVDILDASTIVE